jgi:hypothetical protein
MPTSVNLIGNSLAKEFAHPEAPAFWSAAPPFRQAQGPEPAEGLRRFRNVRGQAPPFHLRKRQASTAQRARRYLIP